MERRQRVRRQISDATEDASSSDTNSEASVEEWPSRKVNTGRPGPRHSAPSSTAPSTTLRKKATGAAGNGSSATIQRSSSGTPENRRQSIKLTVKVQPSKLREVMRSSELDSLADVLGGGKVLDGPRNSRLRTSGRATGTKRYAEVGESDEDEDEDDDEEQDDEEDDEEEEDEEEDENDEEMNDYDELAPSAGGDVETRGEDDDDVEMEDLPLPPNPLRPPKISIKPPAKPIPQAGPKPRLIITGPDVGPFRSMEDQEMADASEDDDAEGSSDLSDDGETNLNEDDAEGEDNDEEEEEEEDEEDEEEDEGEDQDGEDREQVEIDENLENNEIDENEENDDDSLGSSDSTPASGMATPDPARLTKRQRGQPEESSALMALDMAPQQRKFFTDAEKSMRKDEHARKRKELTERKIQEEKDETLRKLLKPQAGKGRGGAPKPETLAAAAAAAVATPGEEEEVGERANPLYTRWVSTKDGVKLGVPDEWLDKKVGKVFNAPPSSGRMVQEIL